MLLHNWVPEFKFRLAVGSESGAFLRLLSSTHQTSWSWINSSTVGPVHATLCIHASLLIFCYLEPVAGSVQVVESEV